MLHVCLLRTARCCWISRTATDGYTDRMNATATSHLPLLTADMPGIGGQIKQRDEDFVVEEVPLYPASGEGTHVYALIEKWGLTTPDAVRIIASALGRAPRDIGFAGMKDAHGVTRQWISIEHEDPDRIRALEFPRIRVLSMARHRNKIKLGHLAGNRFEIRVRDTVYKPLPHAQRIMDVLQRRGVPNYYGPQRFGVRGDNAAVGRAAASGDFDEAVAIILGRPDARDNEGIRQARSLFDAGRLQECAAAWPGGCVEQRRLCRALVKTKGKSARAWRALSHPLRKLYYSAWQSEIFNAVVANRIDLDLLDHVEVGDIAYLHGSGACFRVLDQAAEQPRCDRFEISPSGPLFGGRLTRPSEVPGSREAAILHEAGVPDELRKTRDGITLDGGRRPLRVPLADLSLDAGRDENGDYLRLCFMLPAGAYATAVTRELCR